MQGFHDRLAASAKRAGSWLCVGLDPDPASYPAGLKAADTPEFLEGVLSAVAPVAAAVKPNAAFFEALGSEGHDYLEDVIDWAHAKKIQVIYDCKRGDIGTTAEKYAEAAFDVLRADAVTVNPYMGGDAVEPFARHDDKGVFVLCRTSNASAGDLQDLPIGLRARPAPSGSPLRKSVSAASLVMPQLHEIVARKAMEWNKAWGNVGLVAGATYPRELAAIRTIAGDGVPILIPGVGAQGADAKATISAGADSSGRFGLVNVGRAILQAGKGKNWRKGVADAAKRFAGDLKA